MNSRSATIVDRGVRVSEVPFRSPEHHETCAQSKRMYWEITRLTSHIDDHRARQRHKHSQPRRALADSLMTHHPAWVCHHTGGSRSTPTVHPCPLRWEGCGWLNSNYPHHNLFNTLTSNLFSLTDWTLHGEPSHLAQTPLHAQPMCLPLTLRRVGICFTKDSYSDVGTALQAETKCMTKEREACAPWMHRESQRSSRVDKSTVD